MEKHRRKKGTGTIFILPNGRIRAQMTVAHKQDGSLFRISKIFNTKKEALKWLSEQKSKYFSDRHKVNNILFAEFASCWLEYLKDTTITNKTYQGYESSMKNHIVPYFGKIPLKSIGTQDVNNFIRILKLKGLKAASIYQIKAAFRACMKQALSEDRIIKNPVVGSLSVGKDVSRRKTIAKEDLKKILKAAKELAEKEAVKHGRKYYFYVFLVISYYTGMRPGEVLALRWQDINLDRKIIYVNSAISEAKDFRGDGKIKKTIGRPKTYKSIRPVGIVDKLREVLEKIPHNSDDDFIIKTKKGTPITPGAMSQLWRKLLSSIGLKGEYVMYELRHTYATYLTKLGLPVADISRQMGHTDIRTTMNYYIHMGEDSTRNITDKLNSLM